jgi:hypothetical protein
MMTLIFYYIFKSAPSQDGCNELQIYLLLTPDKKIIALGAQLWFNTKFIKIDQEGTR